MGPAGLTLTGSHLGVVSRGNPGSLTGKGGRGCWVSGISKPHPCYFEIFYLLDTPAEKTAYLRSSWVWIFTKGNCTNTGFIYNRVFVQQQLELLLSKLKGEPG